MLDKEKIDNVLCLSDEEQAKVIIRITEVRNKFIADVNDMMENKYHIPHLFWKHKNDTNWTEFINALSTPLQRLVLSDCPMLRDVFLDINRDKKIKINALPMLLWWKKWRMYELSDGEVYDVYATAQQNIHIDLLNIVNKFNVNMDNRGKPASSLCKLPDAQIEFPKHLHRKAFNDLALGIVQPSQFKNSFFQCVDYIKKYKPKYDIQATGCVFSGGYFINPSGSNIV